MPTPTCQNTAALACKYLEYLQHQRAASLHTIKSYATDLGQFLAPLGVQKILYRAEGMGPSFQIVWQKTQGPQGVGTPSSVEESQLQLLRLAQKKWAHLSPASRNRKTAVLRGWWKWLLHHHHISEDISVKVVSPKVPSQLPHFISVDEALVLLRASHEPQVRALLHLLYGGGLRVSEACGLKWVDLIEESYSLRVRGKGGRDRIVSVPSLTWKSVKELPHKGAYIFTGEQALSPRVAYDWVRAAGARAGLLKPLHPHALRHSFATHMLTSGADLRILQELLGHRSLAATQKYTHLSLDHLARTLEKHHPLSASKIKKNNDLG